MIIKTVLNELKEHEYVGKVRMVYERIVHQEINSLVK